MLAPLFSVYSKNSLGIADFADLKLLIDWCVLTGNSILQLLPMNEMGSLHCPYDALSSFALEPVYLSLDKPNPVTKKFCNVARKKFPLQKNYVNYGIKEEKLCLLEDIYIKENLLKGPGFKQFITENDYWLLDFALYKVLKAYHQARPWYEWEDKFKNREELTLETFTKEHKAEIDFQMWLQWFAFKQIKEVKEYAKVKKVFLMGDLPLLVSRDSADVWAHSEYFKLEFAAGAPPDMYCSKGQRWGMPTYNWQRIAADDYCYLKEKLKYAQNFYDILRIDHVVGLFRIWSIPCQEPLENKGLHGFFDPQDEREWEGQARNILSIILNNTNMLVCAEDLGIIPKACPKTLEELGIPGNDVQRWMKDWNVSQDFLRPDEYRRLSIAMLSTHDTSNWPSWYESEAGAIDKEKLWRHLGIKGPMREKSDREIIRQALEITLEANSIFCINTIIDWLYLSDIFKGGPYQYRINTPGTISAKNWSFVLPLPLEKLLKHKVNKEIRKLIESSGRI